MPDFQTEKQMMEKPRLWPNVLLPLKNRETGELAYKVDARPVIFIGNIFVANAEDQCREFPDTEAIIDAGWRVD
jgi:hypothetical protein